MFDHGRLFALVNSSDKWQSLVFPIVLLEPPIERVYANAARCWLVGKNVADYLDDAVLAELIAYHAELVTVFSAHRSQDKHLFHKKPSWWRVWAWLTDCQQKSHKHYKFIFLCFRDCFDNS